MLKLVIYRVRRISQKNIFFTLYFGVKYIFVKKKKGKIKLQEEITCESRYKFFKVLQH